MKEKGGKGCHLHSVTPVTPFLETNDLQAVARRAKKVSRPFL